MLQQKLQEEVQYQGAAASNNYYHNLKEYDTMTEALILDLVSLKIDDDSA